MTFAMTFMLAFSLSMDTFAAALAKGAAAVRPSMPQALRVGGIFAVVGLATPMMGWLLGVGFARWISAIDHWIAFGLLALVGLGMIREGLRPRGHAVPDRCRHLGSVAVMAAAVATSVDAAAVGVTLAVMEVPIVATAMTIGAVTFATAFGGICLGRMAGPLVGRWAEIAGGALLLALGAKIALQHTVL